jgi:hypothetical protein
MQRSIDEGAYRWAQEEFGHAQLGDRRRVRRLIDMAAGLATHPAGRVLDVYRDDAQRQGAYDFLSNMEINATALLDSMQRASVQRCSKENFVYVPVDGTSLKLRDWKKAKGFGAVGSTRNGARGLKVIHAYAVSPAGVPLGILNQQWWCRVPHKKRHDCEDRPLADKETRHWVTAIEQAAQAFGTKKRCVWFQIDREGDRFWTLHALHATGQNFTVRSAYGNRFVKVGSTKRRRRLRDVARKGKPRGVRRVTIHAHFNRQARTAQVRIRTSSVVLDMVEYYSDQRFALALNVVDVREIGPVPRGQERIHWRLLTNYSVKTKAEVDAILDGYCQRWKIEELHRTWKNGGCRIEQSQLRTPARVIKWAILCAVTAARIERLRMLARAQPETPATMAFTPYEIRALVLMKRKYARRNETISDSGLTISQTVGWLAELGGYMRRPSNGSPGAVTLRRGLEFIAPVAIALELLDRENKCDE